MAKKVVRGYMIHLTEKEMDSLGYIADRYHYAAVLHGALERVTDDGNEYWLSETDAWDFQQAVEDEDGHLPLAGGGLKTAMESILESIV